MLEKRTLNMKLSNQEGWGLVNCLRTLTQEEREQSITTLQIHGDYSKRYFYYYLM